MSSPMGNALGQVWSIFIQEQERQKQIVRNALDAVSYVAAPDNADAALDRLRAGLDALNAQSGHPLPQPSLTPSQQDWIEQNLVQPNGRLQ